MTNTEENSSTWFKRVEYSWFQRFIINCIKSGHTPKHLAFIMDGNRRYAKASDISRLDSYRQGFDKIGEILDYCETFDISIVSVYAFSIENFKRSEDEKNELFSLMIEKIGFLMKELEQLKEKGIRVHVMGDITLFPLNLQQLLAKIVLATKENSNFCLNLCLSYTARDEMTHAVKCLAKGATSGAIRIMDIDEKLFESCMYSEGQPPVDMLIRTSGEVRLSDFMMWQANFAILKFVKVLWPEFGFWHFVGALLDYQRQHFFTRVYKSKYDAYQMRLTASENKTLGHMDRCRQSDHSQCSPNESDTTQYSDERNKRTNAFLSDLQQRRRDFLTERTAIETVGS